MARLARGCGKLVIVVQDMVTMDIQQGEYLRVVRISDESARFECRVASTGVRSAAAVDSICQSEGVSTGTVGVNGSERSWLA